VYSQAPVDSIGGLLGSIQDLVVVVQRPAKLASCRWGAPGVASFLYVSIMACGSFGCADGWSSAEAGTASMTRPRQVSRMHVDRIEASCWLGDTDMR
jgi:hypothetical protein